MAVMPEFTKYIFDCNVWIEIILQDTPRIFQYFQEQNWELILTSYNAVEILRVLKRISRRTNDTFERLENLCWNLWNLPCVHPMFDKPLSDTLISEIRNIPEYNIIAKAFNLEPKDVPYIVVAFKFNATLVTLDRRSLLTRARVLSQRLGVNVLSWSSLLESIPPEST